MSVRALDANGDWTFGAGQNNYLTGLAEVIQNIQTDILSFYGDCFFDTSKGIDYYNLLGGRNTELPLNLAISAAILNVMGGGVVTGVSQIALSLTDSTRTLTLAYEAVTVFGTTGSQQIQFDLP
jgi:hypothetical protein